MRLWSVCYLVTKNAPSDGRGRVPWSRPCGCAARILDVLLSCPQEPFKQALSEALQASATKLLICVRQASPKAEASWHFFNHCEQRAATAGRRLLRLNLDESAVCLFQGGGRGNIFLAKHEPRVQQASLRAQRTYVTLVAFVCDDLDVQRALPQVLVASEKAVTLMQLVAIRAACPAL